MSSKDEILKEIEKIRRDKLKLIAFQSQYELSQSVDTHLKEMYQINNKDYSFILPIRENYFEDGHFKVELLDSVRGKNIYLMTDIGNYSVTYNIHGFLNHMSPNDHMTLLKDAIGACNRHAENINVIMPLLYNGRQHRRNTRESLSCGQSLHELDMNKNIKSFITFDAHDQGVEHAVSNIEFDNFFATNTILENFINDVSVDELKNLVFVAPDNGAAGRRNVYLNSFNSSYIHREAGSFVKQRDYNNLVDGKYPIISHDYCGNEDLAGKTAIVIDDMISSGGSIFDVIDELQKRKIKHIYIIVTYALFTRGIDKFEQYHLDGKFDALYTTNLSYIPLEYKTGSKHQEWLHVCDCSKLLAQIIYNMHNDISISPILRDKSDPVLQLNKKFEDSLNK